MNANVQTKGSDSTALRPFHVSVPEAQLIALRKRISATQWPERETVADQSQGPSSRLCRNSRGIGKQSTTGARSRPD